MDIKKCTKIMKALSNANRLELFLEIVKCREKDFHECIISEIMKCFKIGAPTISHHLKELANAELIVTEKKGKYLVAKVNMETIKELENLFTLNI